MHGASLACSSCRSPLLQYADARMQCSDAGICSEGHTHSTPSCLVWPGDLLQLRARPGNPCNIGPLPRWSSCLRWGLQELTHKCSSMPLCQGFVYNPHGRGNITHPFGALKGNPDGEPIQPHQGIVSPTSYFLGKGGHMADAAGVMGIPRNSSEEAGGLTGATVAGEEELLGVQWSCLDSHACRMLCQVNWDGKFHLLG